MASSVPASLKSAGIVPFATRAAQIEKAKPAVAYWCNYWIVQQLVTKGLHNIDNESKAYTASLMDKLEESKSEHAGEDAITDDVVAKAYLEQFGLEVFNRADNAIRANKTSKQTADNFQAAYIFLELLQIWPPLEAEIAAKIKFAKYHAVRITKAIKAGEDPNLSNPSPDPTPLQESRPLDPRDPDVQALGGLGSPPPAPQPSVEEVPDEHIQMSPSLAPASSLDQSLHPSRVTSAAPVGQGPSTVPPQPPLSKTSAENFYQQQEGGDVSPLAPSTNERASSEGGGYFPHVPQGNGQGASPSIPTNIGGQPPTFGSSTSPSVPAPISPMQPSPTDTFSAGPPHYPQHPSAPAPAPSYPPQQPTFHQPSAPTPQLKSPQYPSARPQQQWQPPTAMKAPSAQPLVSPPSQQTSYVVDDEAMTKAQKHARFAISALNFEDVGTAIKELQGALKVLGAG